MHDARQHSEAAIPAGKSSSGSPIQALRALRWSAAVAWAGWLLSLGLLWWQHWMRILHPPSLLFLFLVALTFGSALVALGIGVWRVLRGPKRLRASVWVLIALLPIIGWTALAL